MSLLQQLKDSLETYTYHGKRIPSYMYKSIIEYIVHYQIDKDDFLWNIVTNNLVGVYRTADINNINLIDVYVGFFYNEVPTNCWGSVDKANNWLKGINNAD